VYVQTATNFDGSITEQGSSVGQTLKRKRMERGFDLADVARETRIPLRHIDAIETDNYDKQPLYPYAVGFVRNYAKFLGLDADPIVRQFKSETTLMDPSLTVTTPEPLDENRLPNRTMVIGGILAGLLLLAVGAYFALRPTPPTEDTEPVTTSQSTDSPVTPAPEPVLSTSVAPPVGTTPTPEPMPTIEPGPAVPGAPNLNPPPPSAITAPVVPVVAPPSATLGAVPVAGISSVGVVLRANEDSWIKVSNGGPKSLKLGILKAGEVYTVPNVPGVILLTGNAGGLDIFVNGRMQPPLGEKGRAAKNVVLTVDGLLGRAVAASQPQR
jgi:cytoskeleton protein RodZ